MNTHQKQIYVMLMKWIHYVWFEDINIDLSKRWIDIVESWVVKNGTLWTIAHIKMIRNVFTRYLCGKPVKRVDMILGIDKDGFPKVLGPYKELINSHKGRRYVLTLLSISRCLPGQKAPDYSTITEPSSATPEILDSLTQYIPTFMERYGIKNLGQPRWTMDDLHYSVKSGPTGPSTLCAQADYYHVKSLRPAWESMARFIGICLDKLEEAVPEKSALRFTSAILGRVVDKPRPSFIPRGNTWEGKIIEFKKLKTDPRRLSIIGDPEAKARVVAIFDYWSQTILRKLHLRLFELLETFKQDRTFTQDPFIPRRPGHHYYSLDLSAATDRFPLTLQRNLVEALIDKEYADGWQKVLVGLPFVTPEGNQLNYGAGQPMGAYSSWAVFAVAHHLVVDYCAHLEGLEAQSDFYILLGDDIVINHDGVAKRYKDTMAALGVAISPLKTHESLTTYEFAKRWFHFGREISGIQLAGFYHLLDAGLTSKINKWVRKEASKCKLKGKSLRAHLVKLRKNVPANFAQEIPLQYHLVTAMLCQLRDRGIPYRLGLNIPDQVLSLYKCLHYKSRHAENLARKATNFNAIMKFLRSHNPDDVIDVVRKYNAIGNQKFMGDFLYPHRAEDKWDLVLRHLYLAMDSSVQSKLNSFMTYLQDIESKNVYAIQELLDQSDVWKAPHWMFHQLPLMRSLIGIVKGAMHLLSSGELESDLKRAIAFTSLPDPL